MSQKKPVATREERAGLQIERAQLEAVKALHLSLDAMGVYLWLHANADKTIACGPLQYATAKAGFEASLNELKTHGLVRSARGYDDREWFYILCTKHRSVDYMSDERAL